MSLIADKMMDVLTIKNKEKMRLYGKQLTSQQMGVQILCGS